MAAALRMTGQTILGPVVANHGERLYALAKSFARPVARGWLSLSQADDYLEHDAICAWRDGVLGPYDPDHIAAGLRHILRLRLKDERLRRELAEYHIRRLLYPMIAQRKPWGSLMAEAHGHNGAVGFPLTEPEVGDIVRAAVYYALPAAPRGGARHVG
jgi:hypothetical protein